MASSGGDFQHLPLPLHIAGPAKLPGGGKKKRRTAANERNRERHSQTISNQLTQNVQQRILRLQARSPQAPPLPSGIPFLLEIEPTNDLDWLITAFDLEIVSEEGDGYVLVASDDFDLEVFRATLEGFAEGVFGTGTAAKIYGVESESDRLRRILSDIIWQEWPKIDDRKHYIIDVGIECRGKERVPDHPVREKYKSDANFQEALTKWERKRDRVIEAWDDLQFQREEDLERFIRQAGGSIQSLRTGPALSVAHLPDSIEARIQLEGQHLKDFVLNFPYLFEVSEPPELASLFSAEQFKGFLGNDALFFLPPDDGAPIVGIIDSGIQEEHRFLSAAILTGQSLPLVPEEPTTLADMVKNGGHGTRVAGAVLFGESIPETGTHQLPFWIQNIRVLNEGNLLSTSVHPASTLTRIVKTCETTSIFNHSINSARPCRLKHMSAWAAAIDLLSFDQDILVVQSSGNIPTSDSRTWSLGIQDHCDAGRPYPSYLTEASCRIASPAESLQALVVGSVAYAPGWMHHFGKDSEPSSFSRTGFGIWDTLKPEVVEYGGDWVHDGNRQPRLLYHKDSCPPLVRSTLQGPGPAHDRDTVGTSFAAPKVARLAAEIQRALPTEPCLLYRALIANSARWPNWAANEPSSTVLRQIGYGIPDREKALFNSRHRVTLITSGISELGPGQAQIYQIPVPPELRSADLSNRIRIDVTLSYAAEPRRTRRTIKRYLATWLTWNVSKSKESIASFTSRVLKDQDPVPEDGETIFNWMLRERGNWGTIEDVDRERSTLQKDWAIIEAHQLPESFCLAVVGHRGWSKNPADKAKYALAVTFEAIDGDLEIYSAIKVEVEKLRQKVRVKV